MKKIIIFFCDIRGTIIGSEKNSSVDYQTFNKILLNLIEQEQANYIVFSLVSSDNNLIVKNEKNNLTEHLFEPIIFGKQFFSNGYIINNISYDETHDKIQQILNYTAELEKDYIISKIYYADDCKFFHELLTDIMFQDNFHDDIFKSIIPKDNIGLKELNAIMEKDVIHSKKFLLTK